MACSSAGVAVAASAAARPAAPCWELDVGDAGIEMDTPMACSSSGVVVVASAEAPSSTTSRVGSASPTATPAPPTACS
eukprot:7666724-Alexandrium_andersonii.AAC.1